MHRQRIRTYPPSQGRTQESLPEVRQPDLDVLFLPRKPIVFAEPLPTRWPVVALGTPVHLIGQTFGELASRLVEGDRGRAQVISDLEQHMPTIAVDPRLPVRRTFVGDATEANTVGEEERRFIDGRRGI